MFQEPPSSGSWTPVPSWAMPATHLHRLSVGPQTPWKERDLRSLGVSHHNRGERQGPILGPGQTPGPGQQSQAQSCHTPQPRPGARTGAARGHADLGTGAEEGHALWTEAAFGDGAGLRQSPVESIGLVGLLFPYGWEGPQPGSGRCSRRLGTGWLQQPMAGPGGRVPTRGWRCHSRSSRRGCSGRRAGTPCRLGR